MGDIKDLFQTADWKKEKHVPVIEVSDKLKKGDVVVISACVGKEIAHPNTTEHHICWVELCFLPKGEKFPYEIGRAEFNAHGASVEGPNTSTVFTHPRVSFFFKTEKAGTILAASYCNIHGLWQSCKEVGVE